MKEEDIRKNNENKINNPENNGNIDSINLSNANINPSVASTQPEASSLYNSNNDIIDIPEVTPSNDDVSSLSSDNSSDDTLKEGGTNAANEVKEMFMDTNKKRPEKHDSIDSGMDRPNEINSKQDNDSKKHNDKNARGNANPPANMNRNEPYQTDDEPERVKFNNVPTNNKLAVTPIREDRKLMPRKNHSNDVNKINKKSHKMDNNVQGQFPKNNGDLDPEDKKEKLKEDAKKVRKTYKKVKTAVKLTKFIKFIVKYWKVILAALAVILVIGLITAGVVLIQSYMPGAFGDVKKIEEDSTGAYTKRDLKILSNIEEIVNKYPGVSTQSAAYVMSTVSYPYHILLHDSEVESLESKLNDDNQEMDKLELLFEPDNELTAKEKYEKYKLIFASGLEAGKEVVESEFKEWLADKFGYEISDDEEEYDDGEIENDMYLTMYKKDKYIEKFDKLMEAYNNNGEEGFNEYLKTEYYSEDDGYKEMINVDDDVKDELYEEIQKDVLENSELYEKYIPIRNCEKTASLTSVGSKDDGKFFGKPLYVSLRDYSATGGTFVKEDYYKAPYKYGTDTDPLEFRKYVLGVLYAEVTSCVDNEACAKAMIIAIKSYTLGRQSMYDPEFLDDKTILHMRPNTGDQDFCDVYEGCSSGKYAKSDNVNVKPALAQDKISKLEEWYDSVSDEFLTDSSGDFVGPYVKNSSYGGKKGDTLYQDTLIESAKKEKNYLNLLFEPDKGGYSKSTHALFKTSDGNVYAASTSENIDCVSSECGVSGSRDEVVTYARSLVGKIKYYFGGKPSSKVFEENNFGAKTTPDPTQGRTIRGLDCSGFVDFVFWHVMNENFGNGNTSEIRDQYSTEINYNELLPGDIGFIDKTGSGTNQHVGIYAGKDDKGNDIWIDCNPSGVEEHSISTFHVYYRPKVYEESDANNTNTCDSSDGAQRVCKKYNLSQSDLEGIAGIALKEQGTAEGAKAEASLMANKYEIDKSSKSLFNYVNDNGWWNSDSKGSPTKDKEVLEAVKDALVNGNRSFPSYVDEHDCIYCGSYGWDIVKLKVNGKTITDHKGLLEHKNYIKDKTEIYQRASYGGHYTFYSFPTEGSDPFGYTKKRDDTCKTVENAAAEGKVTTKSNDRRGTKFYAPVQQKLSMYGSESGVTHDLGAACGSKLYAPASGTATYKTIYSGNKVVSYGNVIYLKTNDGYEIRLGHLQSFIAYKVKYGTDGTYPSSCKYRSCSTYTYGSKKVKEGELIGYTGTSGNSTGCHLHLELRNPSGTRLNPPKYFGY